MQFWFIICKTSDLKREFSFNYIAAIQANLYMTDFLGDNSKCTSLTRLVQCKTVLKFSKGMKERESRRKQGNQPITVVVSGCFDSNS